MRFVAAILCAVSLAGFAPADDILTPSTGGTILGRFAGFEGGTFEMAGGGNETVRQLVSATLSLRLNPPREVTVTPRAGKPEPMELAGFEKGQFLFRRSGLDVTRPLSLIRKIEVPLALEEAAARAAEPAGRAARPASSAPPPPPDQLAEPGRTTLVHFHYAKNIGSARQGSLAAALARDSGGAVALRRIDIPDWSAPEVERYGLNSLPQFWFYDARGELVRKLTDRFTDEDIAAALRHAQR